MPVMFNPTVSYTNQHTQCTKPYKQAFRGAYMTTAEEIVNDVADFFNVGGVKELVAKTNPEKAAIIIQDALKTGKINGKAKTRLEDALSTLLHNQEIKS